MTMAATRQTAEEEIRALLEAWVRAVRAKDVDAIRAACATDLVAFDAHGPLRFEGADAYRRHLEACLSCMQGPMSFEVHELDVAAQGDVGFCHYLALCGGTGPDGKEHKGWMRVTACFRRTEGAWKIVHAHNSAPFDPEGGKVLLHLEP